MGRPLSSLTIHHQSLITHTHTHQPPTTTHTTPTPTTHPTHHQRMPLAISHMPFSSSSFLSFFSFPFSNGPVDDAKRCLSRHSRHATCHEMITVTLHWEWRSCPTTKAARQRRCLPATRLLGLPACHCRLPAIGGWVRKRGYESACTREDTEWDGGCLQLERE